MLLNGVRLLVAAGGGGGGGGSNLRVGLSGADATGTLVRQAACAAEAGGAGVNASGDGGGGGGGGAGHEGGNGGTAGRDVITSARGGSAGTSCASNAANVGLESLTIGSADNGGRASETGGHGRVEITHLPSLLLQKTWVNAAPGDRATLRASRGSTVLRTFESQADSANETDADSRRIALAAGDVVTLSETLAPANSGIYQQALTCTGASDGNPNDGLTVGAGDTAMVCTYSNSRGVADLAISKRLAAGVEVVSGGTVTYELVVTNHGPATVTGAVVKDTPGAGLTCPAGNTVGCSGPGCPASAPTVGMLTGAGITLGTLAAGQSVTLTFACQVP
ncbi:hypothetical protein [Luteimonas sp. e5]